MPRKIDDRLSPEEAKTEIVARLKQHRILSGITQGQLADSAMISVRTVKRFEAGEEISFLNFLKIMKALNLYGGLDGLVADPALRPSLHVQSYKPRKRVATKKEPKQEWTWGDES